MRDSFFEASHRALTRQFTIGGVFGPLEQLDEQRRDALVALEMNKHRVKV